MGNALFVPFGIICCLKLKHSFFSERIGILEMNGEEMASMASVMSENFEPQSKKQRLDNVDGVQQMDFENQMLSESSEGNI